MGPYLFREVMNSRLSVERRGEACKGNEHMTQ